MQAPPYYYSIPEEIAANWMSRSIGRGTNEHLANVQAL